MLYPQSPGSPPTLIARITCKHIKTTQIRKNHAVFGQSGAVWFDTNAKIWYSYVIGNKIHASGGFEVFMDEVALKELMSYPLVEFAKGEHLLSYDDEASYVYYLVEGNCMRQMTTTTGENIFFEEYTPGESVYSLVGPYIQYSNPHTTISTSEMIALSPIRAHRLTAEEFDEFLDRHPTVMKELLYRLLGEYSTLVSNFVAKQKGQAAPRVASFIIERSERVDGKLRFSRFCSVADIARFLGMHRITANKIILALRSAGCIAYNGNCIEIIDEDMLQEYAQGIRKIDYKK